jgi:hypothetical protein
MPGSEPPRRSTRGRSRTQGLWTPSVSRSGVLEVPGPEQAARALHAFGRRYPRRPDHGLAGCLRPPETPPAAIVRGRGSPGWRRAPPWRAARDVPGAQRSRSARAVRNAPSIVDSNGRVVGSPAIVRPRRSGAGDACGCEAPYAGRGPSGGLHGNQGQTHPVWPAAHSFPQRPIHARKACRAAARGVGHPSTGNSRISGKRRPLHRRHLATDRTRYRAPWSRPGSRWRGIADGPRVVQPLSPGHRDASPVVRIALVVLNRSRPGHARTLVRFISLLGRSVRHLTPPIGRTLGVTAPR